MHFFFSKKRANVHILPLLSYNSDILSHLDANRLHFSEIDWRIQKFSSWSWETSFWLFPGYLVLEHIFSSKCFWETDKMKLDNFFLTFSKNVKLNSENLGYKHLSPTKTHWVMIKWIFTKIEVFNFFWKESSNGMYLGLCAHKYQPNWSSQKKDTHD